MAPSWDPERYLTFADERGRPFVELLTRVDAHAPERVVDLGCGPGNLTQLLAQRWPAATVHGIDSSAAMIGKARAEGTGVTFEVADLRTWQPPEPVDVLISNATLQWVPDHLDLLRRFVGWLRPGGWLAFGVPGNFGEPSHTVRRALAAEAPYAGHLVALPEPAAHDAVTYLRALTALGCTVDAWETTYLHVLHGEDPVFTWISGTSLRPMLQALEPPLREQFATELKQRLRSAYPDEGDGVVLPFRRVFVVARVPG